MINTYQSSMAPPPLPERLGRSQPVLIHSPVPSRDYSKSLLRFLVGVVLLYSLLSVGVFIFLYHTFKMATETQEMLLNKQKPLSAQDKAFLSSEKEETSSRTLARMKVMRRPPSEGQKSSAGYLQWDMDHSRHRNINCHRNSWLTIQEPGDYYVYSRTTFSRDDLIRPLASQVKLRKNEAGEEMIVMEAYCSLKSSFGSKSIPQMCTATQGEVMFLERGHQLSVWIQDLSLVDYREEATTFGMYKL